VACARPGRRNSREAVAAGFCWYVDSSHVGLRYQMHEEARGGAPQSRDWPASTLANLDWQSGQGQCDGRLIRVGESPEAGDGAAIFPLVRLKGHPIRRWIGGPVPHQKTPPEQVLGVWNVGANYGLSSRLSTSLACWGALQRDVLGVAKSPGSSAAQHRRRVVQGQMKPQAFKAYSRLLDGARVRLRFAGNCEGPRDVLSGPVSIGRL